MTDGFQLIHGRVVTPERVLDAGWVAWRGGTIEGVGDGSPPAAAVTVDVGRHLIAAGVERGMTVSVGHTDAGYETVVAAFDDGARHVTHLGDAMSGLDRWAPGPVAAALADGRITVEVIADGHHVHAGLLRLVVHCAEDRMVAVTDAVGAAGLPDGPHRLGHLDVVLAGGRVVLRDHPDTLAGSVLTMDRAVATLMAAGVSLPGAVRAATATAARLVGPDGEGRARGELRAGHRADLVVLHPRIEAVATVIAGRVVHDRHDLLTALDGAGDR